MSEKIGNVIKIIDEYRIAINLGKDFVNKDDYIYIYSEDVIKDLDGTELGVYDVCKAELSVTEVYDRFSICESFSRTSDIISKHYSQLPLSPLLEFSSNKKKLNIDSALINELNAVDKAIRIGDIVKLQ